MNGREYEEVKEALRTAQMRRENGQASDADVSERENQLTIATQDYLRESWRGLSEEQREALRDADGQPGRLAERVIAQSIDDGTLRELLLPVEGTWHLPEILRDEPSPDGGG